MTSVKFDRAVKYKGIRYAAHEVFKVDNEDVADLKKVGATVLSADPVPCEHEFRAHEEHESGEDPVQLREELLNYTVAELIKFAQERDIDLRGKTRKADIYNIVVAHIK